MPSIDIPTPTFRQQINNNKMYNLCNEIICDMFHRITCLVKHYQLTYLTYGIDRVPHIMGFRLNVDELNGQVCCFLHGYKTT